MAFATQHLCRKAGCFRSTADTYCDKHAGEVAAIQKRYDKARPTVAARGYGSRWQRARNVFLAENPLCVMCEARGVKRLATQVDHKIPHEGNQELFWDVANWQSLCHTHHSRKTRRETVEKARR